jgi:hypothetical protein
MMQYGELVLGLFSDEEGLTVGSLVNICTGKKIEKVIVIFFTD